MADDYHVLLANSAKVTNVISDGISAALVQAVVVTPLTYQENLPVGTNVKLARKDGSLTAEAVSEAAAYTASASGELTQSTVTLTAAKSAVISKLTVEAEQFGNVDLAKLSQEQGKAIGRLLDDNILALSSGFASTVTASSILTVADLLQAAYTVRKNLGGGIGGDLIGVFNYKGIYEVQKEMMASAAAAYTNPSLVTLLTGIPQGNGYVGSVPGIKLYQTDGVATSGADDCGMVFNPATAFFAMYSPSVQTKITFVDASGFYTSIASWVFSDVKEWNDLAGCTVKSDT